VDLHRFILQTSKIQSVIICAYLRNLRGTTKYCPQISRIYTDYFFVHFAFLRLNICVYLRNLRETF